MFTEKKRAVKSASVAPSATLARKKANARIAICSAARKNSKKGLRAQAFLDAEINSNNAELRMMNAEFRIIFGQSPKISFILHFAFCILPLADKL